MMESESNCQKNFFLMLSFVGVLKGPDPLVSGKDRRIRNCTKISRIWNTTGWVELNCSTTYSECAMFRYMRFEADGFQTRLRIRIRIIFGIWIRIRIRAQGRLRIRIKVKIQDFYRLKNGAVEGGGRSQKKRGGSK